MKNISLFFKVQTTFLHKQKKKGKVSLNILSSFELRLSQVLFSFCIFLTLKTKLKIIKTCHIFLFSNLFKSGKYFC